MLIRNKFKLVKLITTMLLQASASSNDSLDSHFINGDYYFSNNNMDSIFNPTIFNYNTMDTPSEYAMNRPNAAIFNLNVYGAPLLLSPSESYMLLDISNTKPSENIAFSSCNSNIMRQFQVSLSITELLLSHNLVSEKDREFLNLMNLVASNTGISTLSGIIGVDLPRNRIEIYISIICRYIDILSTNGDYGFTSAWESIKKTFITHYSDDLHEWERRTVNFYASKISSAWTKNDFIQFGDHITQRTLSYRVAQHNWFAESLMIKQKLGDLSMDEWESREIIAIKYFNITYYTNIERTNTSCFKKALYNVFAILGSTTFINSVLMYLPKDSAKRDSLVLHLKIFNSFYFLRPFFEALDAVMNVKPEFLRKNSYTEKLLNVLNRIEQTILFVFSTLTLELVHMKSNQDSQPSVADLLNLKYDSNKIAKLSAFDNIPIEIENLKNSWGMAIRNQIGGKINKNAWKVEVFMMLLKDVVITIKEIFRMGIIGADNVNNTGNVEKINKNLEEAQNEIFKLLTIFNFDLEMMKQFLGLDSNSIEVNQ